MLIKIVILLWYHAKFVYMVEVFVFLKTFLVV
jgi:hypothetical protein